MQNSNLLRLTNGGGSSTPSRDETDFNFDLTLDDEMHIEEDKEMLLLQRSNHRHTPFDDRSSAANGSEADFLAEEATESFDEHDSTDDDDDDGDDEFDVMVTRGRAKRQTEKSTKRQKPAKKEKATKKSSTATRPNRSTRAASVRF